MVAAVMSESPTCNNKDNNNNGSSKPPPSSPSAPGKNPDANIVRKPRAKHVASRYLSPSPSSSSSTTIAAATATTTTRTTMGGTTALSSSSSGSSAARRFGSPLPTIKRSQSVDRKRVGYNANAGGELSAAAKLLVSSAKGLVSTSTRSLSVSFQGESFSLPVSKEKAANNAGNSRKPTPERKRVTSVGTAAARDTSGNAKLVDRHRWPGSTRRDSSGDCVGPIPRSFDWGNAGVVDDKTLFGCGSGNVGSFLGRIVSEDSRRVSRDGRLSLDLGRIESLTEGEVDRRMRSRLLNESCVASELTASDTDSVSSGSTSGMQESNCSSNSEISRTKSLPRGIAVSARFWQETNTRLRRLQDPGSPSSMSPGSRISSAGKFGQSKRISSEGSLSAPRGCPSPTRGATLPSSPGKTWANAITSPLRGMLSPSRNRPGPCNWSNGNNIANTPSILVFPMDVRRGKVGEDRIDDAHRLRLLYNCYLQWRFVNARADATDAVQTQNIEKILWGAWITISELRHAVAIKRMKLLLLRRRLTLASILKGQVHYLEDWSQLESDHASSLSGANEALKASTLRLPVIENAVVNIKNLKNVMGSAVDVMQGMVSSICCLSSKAEEMNSLVAELADMISKECFFLDHCKQLLSTLTAMRVSDCSLRIQMLQLHRAPLARSDVHSVNDSSLTDHGPNITLNKSSSISYLEEGHTTSTAVSFTGFNDFITSRSITSGIAG
ncbi:hypothetical protein MLD38_023300 [Melastoma candidum]|uniref:Uncharacterized protein n=1 Tax=Melastoma candidum TaxID=119954 RepID=A0ACB9QN91_9MYRT|nr:hypothetical protein MLD38_023300 [Melastoma candidum]